MDAQKPEEPSIIEVLQQRLESGETLLRRGTVPPGPLRLWMGGIRFQLEKIYGKDSPLLCVIPPRNFDYRTVADCNAELSSRMEAVRRLINTLEAALQTATTPQLGKRVFVGHGRSLVWHQLKDFLRERVHLDCDEFNIEPVAGMPTTTRLESMLEQACFAFIVMTAEEEHADGHVYARPNVIHESGLFQGKLGTRRAIVLLEDGCTDFSNIAGLTHISFPQGNLKPALDDVRRVLEREGLC